MFPSLMKMPPPRRPPRRSRRAPTELTSVRELWNDISSDAHDALTGMIRRLTLVGPADEIRALWLLQHGTKLYMVKARQLAKELFYQRVIGRFGAIPRRALSEPAPIAEMVEMALDAEEEEEDDDDEEEARAGGVRWVAVAGR